MKPGSKYRRLAGVVAVAAVTAACATSPSASPPGAPVVACTTLPIASAPAAGTGGQPARAGVLPPGVRAVAAASPGSAWAVGAPPPGVLPDKGVAAYWNGATWTTFSPRGLPRLSALGAVAAFPGGAWAVGEYGLTQHGDGGGVARLLIVRLTGTTMRRVPVPGLTDGDLADVAATSATNAWAVAAGQLILHWNGTAWTRAPLPAGMRDGVFTAVAASSATNAWAVTYAGRHPPPILHWNGRRWRQVANPDIGRPYALSDVATTSAHQVWAVGSSPEGASRALLLHWNGRRWTCALTRQVHPPKFPDLHLDAVSAASAGNAWAVGSFFDTADRALALHWNGHTWKQVATPQLGSMNDVTFVPRSGAAWAVGGGLLLHWNGTAWR
jgi:hypothetical protein